MPTSLDFNDLIPSQQQSGGGLSFDDLIPDQGTPPAAVTQKQPDYASFYGGPSGAELDIISQENTPQWANQAARSVVDYAKGMVPKSLEEAMHAANIPTDYTDPRQLATFVLPQIRPMLDIGEGAVARAEQVQAAEQTPPFSQERYDAGIGTALDLVQLAALGGLKGKPNAIQKRSAAEVLPREQGEIGAAGSGRERVGQSEQGPQPAPAYEQTSQPVPKAPTNVQGAVETAPVEGTPEMARVQPKVEPPKPEVVIPPDEAKYAGTDIRPVSEGLPPEQAGVPIEQRPQAAPATKHAYTEGRREVEGMDPRETIARVSDEAVENAVTDAFRRDPTVGQRLAAELDQGQRAPDVSEQAILRRHIANVERQHAELIDRVNANPADEAARARLQEIRDERLEAFSAAEKSGSYWGREGRQRQIEAEGAKYTLPRMEAEERAMAGPRYQESNLGQVAEFHKRISALEKQLAARETALAEGRVKSPLPRSRRDIGRYWDRMDESARKRIIERRGRLNVGLDPQAFIDEAIVGAAHISRGIEKASWKSKMLNEFGERVRPHLDELYQRALDRHNEVMAAVTARQAATKVKSFKTRTVKQIQELKARQPGEQTPVERILIDNDPMVQNLRTALEREKYNWEVRQERHRLMNRPFLKRAIDTMVKLERAIKLTGIRTLGKLGGAATQRIGSAALEEAAGGVLSAVPGMRKIMQAAPTEGTPSLQAAMAGLRGLKRGTKESFREIGDIFRNRPSRIESSADISDMRKRVHVPSILDIPGRVHGVEKNPIKAAHYEAAVVKALRAAKRRGEDVTKPGVYKVEQQRAKESGLRSILMNDNALSSFFNGMLTMAEHSKKFPASGYAFSRIGRFLFPIVRVPSNIALEMGTYNLGTLSGSTKLAQVMVRGLRTKGKQGIRPEEADLIARHYKKGMVGAGLFLTGYFGADNFGGLYTPKKGKKDIDRSGVEWGEMKIFGVTVPRWFLHSAAALQLQLGATVRKMMDRGDEPPEVIMEAAKEVIHEAPFVDEMAGIDELLSSNWEGRKVRGRLALGSLVPQGVQDIAKFLDDKKRKPKTLEDYIKSGIPGLREEVPTR